MKIGLVILYTICLLISSQAHAVPEVGNCTLEIQTRTGKLAQEPLKSTKKLKLSAERHQFDLTGTEFQCEVQFSGFNTGTFINCWNKSQSLGIQADRSMIAGEMQSKIPNVLSIASRSVGIVSSIKFWCEK